MKKINGLLTLLTLILGVSQAFGLQVKWTDYVYDHNGNFTELLDGDTGEIIGEYAYDPYGNTIKIKGEAAYENKVRFSTKEVDSSGLYYYGYRYYNPQDGRWQNRDPLAEVSFREISLKVSERNLPKFILKKNYLSHEYAFISNKSLNNIDLFGLVASGGDWIATCTQQKSVKCAGKRFLCFGCGYVGGLTSAGGDPNSAHNAEVEAIDNLVIKINADCEARGGSCKYSGNGMGIASCFVQFVTAW